MSDTPITDSSIIERRHIHKRGGSVELLELLDANVSRKLERERNSLQDQRDFCMGEIERLRKERDEAREALDAAMGWAPQAPDYFNDKTKARWDDDMRKALKVLEGTK